MPGISPSVVQQFTPQASDDYYGDKIEAAESSEFFKNKRQWLDRLFNRLIVDDEYITGRNETVRGARVDEIIEEEFGSGHSNSGWYPALLKADAERKRIVEDRKTAARAAIPSWAEEVAALPAFQAARTQVVRRNVTKTFLADREPLVVSGEFVALLEEEASRVSPKG